MRVPAYVREGERGRVGRGREALVVRMHGFCPECEEMSTRPSTSKADVERVAGRGQVRARLVRDQVLDHRRAFATKEWTVRCRGYCCMTTVLDPHLVGQGHVLGQVQDHPARQWINHKEGNLEMIEHPNIASTGFWARSSGEPLFVLTFELLRSIRT